MQLNHQPVDRAGAKAAEVKAFGEVTPSPKPVEHSGPVQLQHQPKIALVNPARLDVKWRRQHFRNHSHVNQAYEKLSSR